METLQGAKETVWVSEQEQFWMAIVNETSKGVDDKDAASSPVAPWATRCLSGFQPQEWPDEDCHVCMTGKLERSGSVGSFKKRLGITCSLAMMGGGKGGIPFML